MAICASARLSTLPFRREPAEELAQRRKRARERAADSPGAAPRGQEGAERLGLEAGEVGEAGRVPQMGAEESEELAQVALVGFERLRRMPALVAQIGQPIAGRLLQVLAERKLGAVERGLRHERGLGWLRWTRLSPNVTRFSEDAVPCILIGPERSKVREWLMIATTAEGE